MEILTNLLTVAGQVGTLFLMMAVGFLLVQVGWLNGTGLSQMSSLLLYVVAPAIIIDTFQRDDIPGLGALALAVLAIGSFYVIFLPLSGLFFRREEAKKGSVLRIGMVYGNTGFMGLPLLEVVLGPVGLAYGAVSSVIFNIIQWTHGVVVMGSKVSLKKAFLNPGVIGLLLGLPLLLLHARLPGPLYAAVSHLGKLNTPLAMVVIGGQMASANLVATFTQPKLYAVSAFKLVVCPLVTALVLLPFHLPAILYSACVIIAGTPCAGVTAIFAQKFERDTATAAQLITLTTLLSILTLPVFAVLSQTLAG